MNYGTLGWSYQKQKLSEVDYITPPIRSMPGVTTWIDWSLLDAYGYITTIKNTLDDSDISCSASTVEGVQRIGPKGLNHGVISSTGIVYIPSTNVRTVIRCFNLLTAYPGTSLLTHNSYYYLHGGNTTLLHLTASHIDARNGTWRVNGVSVNPVAEGTGIVVRKPTIVSGVTLSGLAVNRIGRDRSTNNCNFRMFEDVVSSEVLSDSQIRQIEQYMAIKWGIGDYNFAA